MLIVGYVTAEEAFQVMDQGRMNGRLLYLSKKYRKTKYQKSSQAAERVALL